MQKEVRIPINGVNLEGSLAIPETPKGIVIFSHGSGSSRRSPRNNFVAKVLFDADIATLLFDLLTEEEDEIYETRFNIPLLTERLKIATKWITEQKETGKMKIGYFGASTGAASALQAAAALGDQIKAVVSRGGRPDMAMQYLSDVKSPTLLIVGGWDEPVINMNQAALVQLNCEKKMEIVPEATHLFEEDGKIEEAAKLAKEWFTKYLK